MKIKTLIITIAIFLLSGCGKTREVSVKYNIDHINVYAHLNIPASSLAPDSFPARNRITRLKIPIIKHNAVINIDDCDIDDSTHWTVRDLGSRPRMKGIFYYDKNFIDIYIFDVGNDGDYPLWFNGRHKFNE